MTINSKLLEQDKLIREQHEAIKKLRTALKIVLRTNVEDVEDVGEDSARIQEAQSGMSYIIDHHNSMISEGKDEIEGILSMLDLEF